MSEINNLPTSSSLKELIDRQELLTNSIESQKNNLKSILESKNVVVSEEENKLSILIQKVNELKVNELGESSIKWLYKDGTEYFSFEEGWVSPYGGIATKEESYLKVQTPAANGYKDNNTEFTLSQKIDLTGYTKIKAEVELVQGHGCLIMVRNKKGSSYRTASGTVVDLVSDALLASDGNGVGKPKQILEIDATNLTGSYYISFLASHTGSEGGSVPSIANCYEIWLEK